MRLKGIEEPELGFLAEAYARSLIGGIVALYLNRFGPEPRDRGQASPALGRRRHFRQPSVGGEAARQAERVMSGPLADLVARHKALALAIARDFPEADEETLADTIEGASDLPQLLVAVLRSRDEDVSLVEALRQRLETLRGRLERFESRAEQKRVLVATAMQEAGLKKLVAPDFTVWLRPGAQKVVVVDESQIPPEFWVARLQRLDRQQLLGALKAGRAVPGALLSNPELSLAVRRQ